MKRLTERFSNGQNAVAGCGSQCVHDFVYCENISDESECTREWSGCPTITEILDKLAYYEDLEEKLENVYGECDGLLETVVNNLVEHEGVDFGKPHKARLLTDEDVDKWKDLKNAEERGLLYRKIFYIGNYCYKPGDCPLICEDCSDNYLEIKDRIVEENRIHIYGEIGKTVFLTKEEAEQALARMEKENG